MEEKKTNLFPSFSFWLFAYKDKEKNNTDPEA